VTDVLLGAVNRAVNPPQNAPKTLHAKDVLSRYVRERLGIEIGQAEASVYDDLTFEIRL
jgi:hypothetical protein